jgi:hypothetical protein
MYEEPQKPNRHIRLTYEVVCENHPESIHNAFTYLKNKVQSDYPSVEVLSEDTVVNNSNYKWKVSLDKNYPNPKYKEEIDSYIKKMEEYLKSL